MNNYDDLKIDEVWMNKDKDACPLGILGIEWSCPSVGFGRFELVPTEDGKLQALTEHMADDKDDAFVVAIFEKLRELVGVVD